MIVFSNLNSYQLNILLRETDYFFSATFFLFRTKIAFNEYNIINIRAKAIIRVYLQKYEIIFMRSLEQEQLHFNFVSRIKMNL